MYSVWMSNLPRPVSQSYQNDLIAALAPYKKSVLGVHVHAAIKGKYLFVDFDSEATARKVALQLNGRKVGNRDMMSKFSKKRKVFRPGSAHTEPLNLVTLYVTNISTEDVALDFLANQCPLAHAIDIPMPFKHMAFFQFTRREDAQKTAASIRDLQRANLDDSINSLAMVVNAETQDLITSDRLTDIHLMIRAWDEQQLRGGLPASTAPTRSHAAAPATTAAPALDLMADPAHPLSEDWPAVTTAAFPAPAASGSGVNSPQAATSSEEVYESDDEDFLELVDDAAGTTEYAPAATRYVFVSVCVTS